MIPRYSKGEEQISIRPSERKSWYERLTKEEIEQIARSVKEIKSFMNYTGKKLVYGFQFREGQTVLESVPFTEEEALTCALPTPEPNTVFLVPKARQLDSTRPDVQHAETIFNENGRILFS